MSSKEYFREYRAKNKARIAILHARYNSKPSSKEKAEASRLKRYAANPGKKQAERRTAAINRRAKFTARMLELKGAPCIDCGQCFPPCAMDFDHVRGQKKFEISRGLDKPWAIVLEEIAKCDLVCAVHHRIRTAERLSLREAEDLQRERGRI